MPTQADHPADCPAAGQSITLIAGNGAFPRLFIEAARKWGVRVFVIGLVGETQPSIAQDAVKLVWIRVGQLGKMVRQIKQWQTPFVALAGGVDKRRLFKRARLDWQGLRLLMAQALRRDDSLLRAVATTLEQSGAKVISSTVFLTEALAPRGPLTSHTPSKAMQRDLSFGLEIARTIGSMDIGQTVVVRSGAVVALEAIEGTDACIRRAGELTMGSGAVVVKVAKPTQDMRFDVPVIGPETIETLRASKVNCLGIEAHRTLLLEPQQTLALAERYRIAVIGLA